MTFIIDRKKAYINPQTVEFDGSLKINGETVKESLTEEEQREILNALEYDGVHYVKTE